MIQNEIKNECVNKLMANAKQLLGKEYRVTKALSLKGIKVYTNDIITGTQIKQLQSLGLQLISISLRNSSKGRLHLLFQVDYDMKGSFPFP